ERDPGGSDARQSGRYPLTEYGLKKATERVLKTWKAARAEGALHVEYLGVQKLKEAGDRECWVLCRSRYNRPENDGVTETTVWIDRETWLQLGSVVRGEGGRLIGEYYFRDIEFNPQFRPNQFEKSILTEKGKPR